MVASQQIPPVGMSCPNLGHNAQASDFAEKQLCCAGVFGVMWPRRRTCPGQYLKAVEQR
jgi:hypothetical protein